MRERDRKEREDKVSEEREKGRGETRGRGIKNV